MRIDWYTKGVLSVIAALLGVIAIRPYVSPTAVAHAQAPFEGVQYGGGVMNAEFFDTRTGVIWIYFNGKLSRKLQLVKLGDQLYMPK